MTHRNDIDKLVGDDCLTTSVVLELQRANHVTGVVGSVLHGRSPGGNLGGVSLDESSVDGVGETELGEVLGDILLHLVLVETGRGGEGLGGDDGGDSGLVGDGGDVVVGDDSDLWW